MKKTLLFLMLSLVLAACDNTAGAPDADDEEGFVKSSSSSANKKSSSSNADESSSSIDSLSSSSVSDSIDLPLVRIPAQTFMRVNTEVSVSTFEMLSTEVTQGMYAEFAKLPEQKVYGNDLPVANVTWYEAALFCNALSKKYGLDTAYAYSSIGVKNVLMDLNENMTVKAIRLPTEAEWEAAARAGTTSKYYWGTKEAMGFANYKASGHSAVISVGSLTPNAYGLYDMSGNVAEWVNDWYSAYPDEKKLSDPVGPKSTDAKTKAHRGGSYASATLELASGEREYADPAVASFFRGFRIVKK